MRKKEKEKRKKKDEEKLKKEEGERRLRPLVHRAMTTGHSSFLVFSQ